MEASKKGNLVPLYHCIFSDQLTPVLAYRCLVKEDDREAPSFLFESVEPGFQVSSVVSPMLHIFVSYVTIFDVICTSNGPFVIRGDTVSLDPSHQ